MIAVYVIGSIIIYLFMTGLTHAIIDEDAWETEESSVVAIFWPVTLPIILGYRLTKNIRHSIKNAKL